MNKIDKFIGYAINDLLNHNVDVVIKNKRYRKGTDDGWFSSDKKLEFVCNLGGGEESRICLFLHEYSHFLQWKNKSKFWFSEKYDTAYNEYFEFKSTTHQLKYQNLIQEVEQDCDRIAINLIDIHKLPVNKEEYIRESNWYIWFYNYVTKINKWPNLDFIDIEKINKICPKRFIGKSRYNKVPIGFEDTFKCK